MSDEMLTTLAQKMAADPIIRGHFIKAIIATPALWLGLRSAIERRLHPER